MQTYLSMTAPLVVGFHPARQCRCLERLPAEIQQVIERNAETFALLQREDVEMINAAGAELLAVRGMVVNPADIGASGRRSAIFTRAGAKGRPATWRLLETYAGEISADGPLDSPFGSTARPRW